MHGQSLSPFPISATVGLEASEASPTPNPQPEASSVGNARYNCVHYSTCLGTAADKGWMGLSCTDCMAYRSVPSEAVPYDACAQLLGAVLRTAQHDLEHSLDDSFWEAATFVFHQQDFSVLCGLLDIDPDAARQAQWTRLTTMQQQAIADRWPQATRALH